MIDDQLTKIENENHTLGATYFAIYLLEFCDTDVTTELLSYIQYRDNANKHMKYNRNDK